MVNQYKSTTDSFAILNSDPKTIAQNLSQGITTIENINVQSNIENGEPENANNIIIHTRKDNLIHNYFHYFYFFWDARDPLSSVTIKLPKTEKNNTKYWINYIGEVDIYIGANVKTDNVPDTTNKSSGPQIYWNTYGMKPLFRGEIGNIKEYPKVLEIHIDSIGKRFKQKIPDEFRQSYINNQNVRDAFQAICEFIGVKYICPPASAKPEDEETPTESATTDGDENNVTDTTNAEKKMAAKASKAADKASKAAAKAASKAASEAKNKSNNAGTENTDSTEGAENTEDQSLTEADTETPQNGYGDISFDANGAIVHGSTVIETSPDMAETLIALEEHPLQKYMEDTTFVAADVKKFLNGEFFETVHGNVLNYGAITVEPKSASSSDMSTVTPSGTTGDTENQNGENSSGSSSGSVINAPQPTARAIAGHSSKSNKIYLNQKYINSLPPSQAGKKAQQTNTYTEDTLKRLRRRAMGLFW